MATKSKSTSKKRIPDSDIAPDDFIGTLRGGREAPPPLVRSLTERETRGPWTQFWDMSSGGGKKLPWKFIYIQASEAVAKAIFRERFDRDPENVTCSCCGEDFSIHEEEDLYQATGHHRQCDYKDGKYVERDVPFKWAANTYAPLDEYVEVYQDIDRGENILVLYRENEWAIPAKVLPWLDRSRKNAYGYP